MIENIDIGTILDNEFIVIDKYGGEGKSGFGTVFIIYNDDLKKALAMKTLQDKYLNDEEVIEDFKKESLIWTELKHPNIVEAYGLDIIDGRLFIIMEPIFSFMGKQSLDDYFFEGLSDYKILDWSIQFCYAMEYMEEQGIEYHGDIKPQNILIWDNEIKITDFGLTSFINESRIFKNKNIGNYYNSNGKICGTNAYMAPESFEGLNNISTDIYSFGIVLFQMINKGKLPFKTKNNTDNEWEELHKKAEVPYFNHILYDVVLKCLSKNPKDRYDSFKDLKMELISIFKENFDEDPYVPKEKDFEKDSNYYYFKGNSLANVGDIENFISNFDKAVELNPYSSDIRINYAINLIKYGYYDKALNHLNVAKNIFDENNKNFVSLDRLYFNFGHAYQSKGYLNKAIENYENAIDINENYLESYVNLGNIYKELGLYETALEKYQLALDINPNFFMALINMGETYSFLGNYKDSANCFYKAKYQDINEDLYSLWGQSLRRLNREPSALTKFFEILKINEESMYAYYNIIISYLILDNLDQAKEYFGKALNLFGDNIAYYFFNPRGYLIAQYANWLFDLELLEHLPQGLINKLDAEFEKIGNISSILDFEKYFYSITSFSELDVEKCKSELRSYYEFNKFINEFNENCKSGRFIDKFKELYLSNLNEMEIIRYIIFTRDEIKIRSVEDFIVEEKLLKLDLRRMKREINENEL